jgi:putative endonuclease
MKRQAAEARGRRGEALARLYLRLHGWRILAERVKTGVGEVDLVAQRGSMIAFVEVKTRRTQAELDLAIDARRLERVARAASMLAPRFAKKGEDVRIDVLLVMPWRWPRHIVNAWQP